MGGGHGDDPLAGTANATAVTVSVPKGASEL